MTTHSTQRFRGRGEYQRASTPRPLRLGVELKLTMKLRMLIRCGAVFALVWVTAAPAAETKPLYENNFEQAALEKVPDEMLVLDGGFAVREEGGNKFLELPGAPLGEGSGVLFGPTESAGLAVSARIHGTSKGRRAPAFAVGLNGVGGFKLQVSAAKKLLELYKGEEIVATAPYTWESDKWTLLRLQARKAGGEFKLEGKAWLQGGDEPKTPQISFSDKAEAVAGRASLWGNPFSGTAIRYDDLRVTRVEEK